MTTNAIDRQKIIVASDSRWSAELDSDHVVVLDDSGFHKLAYRSAGSLVVAGDLVLIEGWMKWFTAPGWDLLNRPKLNRLDHLGRPQGIVFHLVFRDGRVMHPGIAGPVDFENKARFVGTGAAYARDCYAVNACVKKSVTSASEKDVFTGGATLHVDYGTGEVVIPPVTSSASQVQTDIVTRGTVMNRQTLQPVCDLQEFAARKAVTDNTAAANFQNLTISAPTGVPAFVWTQEQEGELMKAFAEMALLEQD